MAPIIPRVTLVDQTGTAIAPGAADFTATNARIDTTNTKLDTLAGKLPTTVGQATKAASLSVTVASDQGTLPVSLSAVPLATGAATDATLTTLAGKFPTALGQTTKAGALSVVMASDAPGAAVATPGFQRLTDGTNSAAVKAASTAPAAADPALVVTMSPNSVQPKFRATGSTASVTVGTSAANALAANASRSYLFVQNNSASDIWMNFSGTATVGTGIKIPAGQAYENPAHFAPTGAVSLIGAAGAQAATAVEA